MGFAGLAAIAIVVVGLIAYLAYRRRKRTIETLGQVALRLGLRYSESDPGNVLGRPFTILGRGQRRHVRDFLYGQYKGRPVMVFDLEVITEHTTTNAQGAPQHTESHEHFTCAMVGVPAVCPRCSISRENFFTRLGHHIGLRDVELESGEFNHAFRVHCDDQRFAFSLLDARMMQWLLQAAQHVEIIETLGNQLMLAVPRLDAAQWGSTLDWFDGFLAQVPDVVYSTYGTPGAGGGP